ncbi:MAG: GreA/GreB family elongation factor [Capsulimonadales bacterium]|nr:GreA/GreB family elongation factor [Capsulimonadales bacterium]
METMPPNAERVAGELIALGRSGVVLGVFVTEQAGLRATYALVSGMLPDGALRVGDWDVTPISAQSPIGRRLQEAQIAEEVVIRTPNGDIALEVISVNGCPLISPQERLRLRKLREEERQTALAARWAAEQEAHRRRVRQQKEQAELAELKLRRKERDRNWRHGLTGR